MSYLDYHKLNEVVYKIINSNDNSLFFYRDLVRYLGIYDDGRKIYFDENKYINPHSGLWQEPNQFASLLTFLSSQKVETYCEIGTFKYWCFILICAVLYKNNKNLKVVAIDCQHNPDIEIINLLEFYNINFEKYDTSDQLKGQKFDLVMIDADHCFEGVYNDWINLGSFSKICLFHDINDKYIKECSRDQNGPYRVFSQLECPKISIVSHNPIMGIGICFNY